MEHLLIRTSIQLPGVQNFNMSLLLVELTALYGVYGVPAGAITLSELSSRRGLQNEPETPLEEEGSRFHSPQPDLGSRLHTTTLRHLFVPSRRRLNSQYTVTVDPALAQGAASPDALVAQLQQANTALESRLGMDVTVIAAPAIHISAQNISVNATMQREASCQPGFWVSCSNADAKVVSTPSVGRQPSPGVSPLNVQRRPRRTSLPSRSSLTL